MQEELDVFLREYEEANNSHNWDNVESFIAPDATYWFTDGSYLGIEEIRAAVEATFTKIQNEVYEIKNVRWPLVTNTEAVCTYNFLWRGTVDGQEASGSGRGTNVLKKIDGSWQIVHEHLSS
jgi:ketosteroid isomerase-like protein